MTIAMIPNAMMVDRISDFRCLLMVLNVVFGAKIVKISVLICLDMRKGLVGFFAVPVGLGVHAIGVAIVKYGLALVNCFARLSASAFESGGDKSTHSFICLRNLKLIHMYQCYCHFLNPILPILHIVVSIPRIVCHIRF
jgi:hypothetical protein